MITTGTIGLIDGGGTTVPGFAPMSPVPEPSSLALFGGLVMALGGVALYRRRQA
jgi:hypothetical protein